MVRALANVMAGRWSDRFGRKPILIAGWLLGLPAPLFIINAPNWNGIVFANILLGIDQGLCWSTTVIMKIDLVGPQQCGLAMGLNEFAGYLAVALAALASGYLAAQYGLRPAPFYLGLAVGLLGLLFSIFFVHETQRHVAQEAALLPPAQHAANSNAPTSSRSVFWPTSWRNRTLFAASQAGLVNDLNDGMLWGRLPIFLAAARLSLSHIGIIAAVYPGVWGISQLSTGALSDRWGRKWMIALGMMVQALGIALSVVGKDFWAWLAGAVLLGLGTALVDPALLAAISDVAPPAWRASAVGVYRLWRDAGSAAGALAAGLLADAFNLTTATAAVAGLTFLSGIIVAAVMSETLPGRTHSHACQPRCTNASIS